MKRNFFEVLNLPVKLVIDHNELKKNYFNLLKENSADPILNPNGPANNNELKVIEQAFQTLKDRITRISHVLQIEGLRVANDNKAPINFADTADEIQSLIQARDKLTLAELDRLKQLQTSVVSVFSSISMELSKLENAWDESPNMEILKRIRRKSAAFSYVRGIDQNIRDILK